MVQKYQSPVRVYKYPFELVMLAYERRFPKCPQMPIVLDCQVTEDEILAGGASRKTGRRCKLAVEAPYLFKKLIGLDVVYFVQTNFLDRAARSLSIEATNETYASRIEIFERCRYYAHPENADWTCFDQTATLDIKNFFGFEHSMEKMGMKQYTQMTLKGKEIIEHFIEELRCEGVTSAPVWEPDPNCAAALEAASEAVTMCPSADAAAPAGDAAAAAASELPSSPSAASSHNDDVRSERSKSTSASPQRSSAAQHHADASASRKPSISEYEDMLDVDYIQAKLGDLEPLQESKLLQLRGIFKELSQTDGAAGGIFAQVPAYATLLRFLRARDFSVDKAAAQLQDTLRWRHANGIDGLLGGYQQSPVLQAHFPGGWHRADRDGRPLYILRLGHMDVKGLLKALGEEGLLNLALHICEEGLVLLDAATAELGKPVTSWSLLVDLEGLSMRHLWRPGVKALLRIIETVERNYPETLGRVFVVRAPRVFPIAWTIVSAFIDEHTRTKFLFYGGSDCMNMKDGLELYIDPTVIPDFLGGPCTSLIHEGSLVPKTLYLSTIEEHSIATSTTNGKQHASSPQPSQPLSSSSSSTAKSSTPKTGTALATRQQQQNSSLYKSVLLEPGHLYELVLRNDDPKSVLTWDFDVVTGCMQFAVLRIVGAPALPLNGNDDPSKSVLDGAAIADKCIEKAEPMLVCQAMESVQGSHVMTHRGHYILQWSCPPGSEPAAQLMHFHEILSSHNYRGSMSSLQSGVSALSLNSSMPSR